MFNIEFDKEKKCFIKPEKGILPDEIFSMYTIHYLKACRELEKISEIENITNKNFIYNSWNNQIIEINNIVNNVENENNITDENFFSSLKPITKIKMKELADFYHNETREGFVVKAIDHFDHSYISFIARQGMSAVCHAAMCAEISIPHINEINISEQEDTNNLSLNNGWISRCIEPKYKVTDCKKIVLRDTDETMKQTPPKGRSVKQHNLILNFNKKNKRK